MMCRQRHASRLASGHMRSVVKHPCRHVAGGAEAAEAAEAADTAASAGRERGGTPSSSSQGQSAPGSRAKERSKIRRRSPPDVKIVCIMRLPKPEVSRLVRMYPEELNVDRNGDARTRFRRLHGAEVCVEISGYEGAQG